ncbi:hypothetical protein ACDA63_11045 [Uliginosibacterium sp. sgz301328]|uniref:hypothetical protein n=1 Tax=Uliginosibacterium sp. sgz301328 TaxID=3243764 RepID=UPI00359DA64F
MADIKDAEHAAFHASYQQLQDGIKRVYNVIAEFERGKRPEPGEIPRAAEQVRDDLERWLAATSDYLESR